ncbi:thiol:disulfide interchange protein [Bordetella genomosp. 5]|uniref:Thiol:disulfide interchange protein n=1 Tax=Bordetella genomosp. 5 TaxID=1395608 RepID=A0A261U105_9BORD|nr:thiol:disulfide interchange protein DsbA/DsbL [Bordetella genomosp. 5]OZI33765.1 thiol:disulfide interchange protein [Bordetella genomosp. 5]OZI55102.1 thiol:disulfide interchange protein [Bordetella genomosp. 5]
MQSNTFSRLLAATALAAASLFAPMSQAQGTQQYVAINPPLPSDTPGKIEVLEFFAYSCPHCAAMQPMVEDWAKTAPSDVVLKQVPIAFNAGMKPLQQLYYTLAALDRLDLNDKVFTAIHGERKRLFDKKAMGEWAASQGVDRARFDAVFDSFSVQTQVERANQLAQAYRIEGTPSFSVGGKFMTSPVLAGNSYEGALKEIDRLIPMARQQ